MLIGINHANVERSFATGLAEVIVNFQDSMHMGDGNYLLITFNTDREQVDRTVYRNYSTTDEVLPRDEVLMIYSYLYEHDIHTKLEQLLDRIENGNSYSYSPF